MRSPSPARTLASGEPSQHGQFRQQPWSDLDDYDRASPAVDCVVLTVVQSTLHVLIHRRKNPPFEGEWALPGVFVQFGEPYGDAAERALRDKAGVDVSLYKEQLESRNEPDRDPRGWVITVAFLLLAPAESILAQLESDEAVLLAPFEGHDLIRDGRVMISRGRTRRVAKLAFDHDELVRSAVRRLRRDGWYSDLLLEMMPREFTLRELQGVFEVVLGRRINRASFRRHVLEVMRIVEPTGASQTDVGHRPAALYRRRTIEDAGRNGHTA